MQSMNCRIGILAHCPLRYLHFYVVQVTKCFSHVFAPNIDFGPVLSIVDFDFCVMWCFRWPCINPVVLLFDWTHNRLTLLRFALSFRTNECYSILYRKNSWQSYLFVALWTYLVLDLVLVPCKVVFLVHLLLLAFELERMWLPQKL